jgi:hypothetical protein
MWPVNYRFINMSIVGLAIWALTVCAEVVVSISWLRDHGISPGVQTVLWTVFGLTFACLLLFFSMTDISLSPDTLSWRRRTAAFWLLRIQPSEGGIRRSDIKAFRMDRDPWNGQTMTLLLHSGPAFAIPEGGREDEVENKFDSFVCAFRAFAISDSSHKIPELENIWQSSSRRVAIGIVSVTTALLAVSTFFLMKIGTGQLAIVFCTAGISFLGLRFLLKRD